MKRFIALFILLAALAFPALAADIDDVRALMQLAPTRNMGSENREKIDRYVASRFKATGFENGQITFETAAYVPGKAVLHLSDGKRLPLYGLGPNVVHPGNLPGGKWSGKLVDLGMGTAQDMSGESLTDAAVLMDMGSRRRWVSALELGARILIFAGSEKDNGRLGADKFCKAPLSVSRYYLNYADSLVLRRMLKERGSLSVRIEQTRTGRWKTVTATNDWVIVPGGKHADKVMHIQAYKDANSFVPELTPGAESAANLALMLRLLDHYTRNKPQCTIIFSAVSDHCNYLRGEQTFMGYVYPEEKSLARELAQRERDLAEAVFYAKVYADQSPEQVLRIRSEMAKVAGRTLPLKKPVTRKLEYQRNVVRHAMAKIELRRKKQEKADAASRIDLGPEHEALKKKLKNIIAVMGILQRWGASANYEDLSVEQQAYVMALMKEMEQEFTQKSSGWQAQLDEIHSNLRLRDLLAGKTPLLFLSLDISFGNEKMGFFYVGGDCGGEYPMWQNAVIPLARLSLKVATGIEGGERYLEDTILNTGGVSWRNHLANKFQMACTTGQGVLLPSLTLTTTGDTRDLRFTPSDTLDNVNPKRMADMLDFAHRLLVRIVAHEDYPTSTRLSDDKSYLCGTVRYNLRRIDPFSVEIPTEPVPRALAVAWFGKAGLCPPILGQVTNFQVASSDQQGAAMFRGLTALKGNIIEAFHFDGNYNRVDMAIDAGSGARRLDPTVKWARRQWKWYDHIALMFDCVQTDIVGLLDPADRTPIYYPEGNILPETIIILDAVRESSPDHYGIAAITEARAAQFLPVPSDLGVACVFTEEDMPFKIIGNRLLLVNATKDKPDGAGFRPGDKGLRTISYTAARDTQTLNSWRMARIAAKGVKNLAAQTLYKRADDLIKEAETAQAEGSQADFLGKSVEGLNCALESYTIVRNTTTDLIKAVAMFMALVIPFCAFLMKLITPWTDIRAQIFMFVLIFVLMAVSLGLLHPAFSLSQTPMMVVLAFLMIGLAVFVMFVLHSRFDAGMQQMVEEAQGVESTESSRKTLAGVAFAVGVNNMRRRRIRTTLTSLTIVLVTFTMLSVISVGQALSPYLRRTEKTASYNGVLFAKPGMAKIRENEMQHVVSILAPYGTVVRRTWTQRLDAYGGYMPQEIRDPASRDKVLYAKSLFGVQAEEADFLKRMPLAAGKWFSADDAREVILTVEGAKLLGISPKNFTSRDVTVRSQNMKLVGLLRDEDVADQTDLARLPFLPVESIPDPTTGKAAEDGSLAVGAEDAADGPAPAARPIPSQDCVFVPYKFALTLPDTSYRTIALKTDEPEKAWEAANRFVQTTGLLTYAGITGDVSLEDGTKMKGGEYSLGAPVGATIGGVSKVVIPICLAATIILNTMLGAVMERKKEISIYNSIGLNPTHVFVFFVAEALVFGLIGAVAGYLIGQGLGQVIVYFGLLGGVNLNYSSMSVMVVIMASMATVVVSTLYPAYIATQSAVPSGQRRWRLPAPDGDSFELDFPFSFSEAQLPGVLAYFHAYMDLNSEASSGQFLAQNERFGYVVDEKGRKVMTMIYSVTPVPFDLGVNQNMEVYAYYQPTVRAHVLSVRLTRAKGDRSSWLVVNQPFLEGLRGRLLGWRSQSGTNQQQFMEQGKKMFANAPDFPLKKASS